MAAWLRSALAVRTGLWAGVSIVGAHALGRHLRAIRRMPRSARWLGPLEPRLGQPTEAVRTRSQSSATTLAAPMNERLLTCARNILLTVLT